MIPLIETVLELTSLGKKEFISSQIEVKLANQGEMIHRLLE